MMSAPATCDSARRILPQTSLGEAQFYSFSESLPSVGFDGNAFSTMSGQNQYVRKHNPWVNWQALDAPAHNHLALEQNQPWTSFPTNDFTQLPTVSIFIPNEVHD